MIILFDVNEKSFTNLGLGILTDAIGCVVKEKLNDEFTLEMEYPVNGKHFNKIQNNRILYCKPNPYEQSQAFRIYSITKPINGTIVVNASHISYDLNSIPINAISGENLQDLLIKIQNEPIIEHDFIFNSEVISSKTFKTTSPYNLRAILMGSESSIISEYDVEVKFNNFIISLLSKRGKSSGAMVRYGHNMTDLNHELSTELLYNGVFPFYHTETEKNETTTEEEFTKVFIVGSKPLQDGWLSYSKDGQPYHPIDTSPVQIATEGDYYQKVYVWNEIYNVYQEKLYNQTVTILQGVLEPDWIIIEWTAFPNIVCKASRKGYFKLATDDNWGTIKGVGDVIFEGNIASSGLMENMILYYSEVIPSRSESTNTDVTEVVDVQLDNKIIWLDTPDAKSMKYNKILMLDLTSEFEDEPTKIRLQAKAEEFINKNKIGSIKHSTTVSFIDLSSTTEKNKYENFDHIEIGDTVKIIYEDADISIDLRVITTEYDVISKRYASIELGEKKETMTSESVQSGDNVSSLTNDVSYATITTVNKLIADVVTANYIEALNAKLTQAQISQLEVERINVKGIIEASQFTLDSLVAILLVAENANISNTLMAGQIKVAGDITINSGQITITSDKGTNFIVDREGNLTANSVSITGGTFNINDGMFEVTNEGVMTAKDALIRGHIEALTGEIGGFTIENNKLYTHSLGSGIFISPGSSEECDIGDSGNIDGWSFTAGSTFGVTKNGKLFASQANIAGSIVITGGSININEGQFEVNEYGNVTIKSGSIQIGEIPDELFPRYVFEVNEYGDVIASSITITGGSLSIGGTNINPYFRVSNQGAVLAKNIEITGGSLSIGGSAFSPAFYISPLGEVTAKDLTITGGSITLGNDFSVSSDGEVEASDIKITGGSITLGAYFNVDPEGKMMASSGTIATLSIGFIDSSELFPYMGFGSVEAFGTDDTLFITPEGMPYGTGPIIAGSEQSDDWALIIGSKFGVKLNGEVYLSGLHIVGRLPDTNLPLDVIYTGNDVTDLVDSEGNLHTLSGIVDIVGGTVTADYVAGLSCEFVSGKIGGFMIGSSVLYKDSSLSPKPGNSNSVWVSIGTQSDNSIAGSLPGLTWAFAAGSTFGVTTSGSLFATHGKIGGFVIGTAALYNDSKINPKPGDSKSVWVSLGTQSSKAIAGSATNLTWAFTASDKFGVTKEGALYSTSGKIAGFTISGDKLYIGDTPGNRTYICGGNTYNPSDPLSGHIIAGIIRADESLTFPTYAGLSGDLTIVNIGKNLYPTSGESSFYGLHTYTMHYETQSVTRKSFIPTDQIHQIFSLLTTEQPSLTVGANRFVGRFVMYYITTNIGSSTTLSWNLANIKFKKVLSVMACSNQGQNTSTYNVTCWFSGTTVYLRNNIAALAIDATLWVIGWIDDTIP